MTTVYLTSNGSYSDWRVTGIFSTREKAEEHRRQTNSHNNVDEYVIDAEFNPDRVDMQMYRVYMEGNGNGADPRTCEYQTEEKACAHEYSRGEWRVITYCYARDEQHAIKIANEKRIGLILEGKIPACQ